MVDRFELVTASATPRNGSGHNPMTLSSTTLPVIGNTWDLALDRSAHNPSLALLGLNFAPSSGTFVRFGEVLVQPNGAIAMFAPHAGNAVTFSARQAEEAACGRPRAGGGGRRGGGPSAVGELAEVVEGL